MLLTSSNTNNMAKLTTALTLLLLVAVATANHLQDYEDFQQLMKILSKPRILERDIYSNKIMNETGMVKGLKWHNCGHSSDPLQIKALFISPSPVSFSHPIKVSFSTAIRTDLTAPIQVKLTVQKKILFWITIPCVNNVGSCTYENVCQRLTTASCPPEFKKAGIPCQCPIKKGMYQLPRSTVTPPKVSVPGWLEDGDYRVTAKLTSKGRSLGCLHLQLSLHQ